MPYAIMRFQKCAAGGVAAKNRHNERLKSEYKSNPNIDRDRTKNNYHLVEPHGKYKQCYTEMIERAGCRTRSNSTVLVETLLTASPEFMNQLNPQEQRQFFERAAAFLYERIGKENVVSAIVHMDETTPHMHLCFCPITKDGRLSAKEILGNKADLSKWQDAFYEHMHGYYPALERGLPSAQTHRKHIPAYLFRALDDAVNSIDTVDRLLSDITVFNAGKKKEEAKKELGEHLRGFYTLAAHAKQIDAYARSLELANAEKDKEIASLSDRLEETDLDLTASEARVRQLKAEKDHALALLASIPPELRLEIERKMSKAR